MTGVTARRSKVRAWWRIIAMLFVLSCDLIRLLILDAVLKHDEERGFKFRRGYTQKAMKILGVELRMEGTPVDFTVLYVSNHRSLLDPIVQLRFIDAYIVSKSEVDNYPLIGKGARATGVVFVTRESKESRAQSRDAIKELLRQGKSVLIYPEGTTSDFNTTQDFRPGSFEIAMEAGVPVVPVAIHYGESSDHWADGPMLPFFVHKFSKRRIRAWLSIGEPIHADSAELLKTEARNWIGSKVLEFRRLSQV